jgi:hypothetical protein
MINVNVVVGTRTWSWCGNELVASDGIYQYVATEYCIIIPSAQRIREPSITWSEPDTLFCDASTQTDEIFDFAITCDRGSLDKKEATIANDIFRGLRPETEGMFDGYLQEKCRLMSVAQKRRLREEMMVLVARGQLHPSQVDYMLELAGGLE